MHRYKLWRPLLICLALLMALGLSACGSSSSSSSSGASLRIWYSTDDPVERDWSQQLATRYMAAHPNVHVTLTAYDFEDLNPKLQLALNAGNPPDLAYVTPRGPGIPAYVGAHKLLDLSSAAKAHDWAQKLRSGLLSQYNQPFGFLGAKRGSVVAVPTSLAAVGMLYNKQLLSRLHMTVPHTLAQFEADAAAAKKAGYTPLGMGNGDGWLGDDWYLTLVNALVPPSKLQPEQVLNPKFSFKAAPYKEAGSILQDWAKKNYLTPNFGGLDAQEGIDLFFHGKTLFQMVSSSENAQIKRDQERTHLPIGVFAFPAPSGVSVVPSAGYLGWVVPKDGKNHALAISFINSLLQPSTTAFLLKQGVLPATRDVSVTAAEVAPSGNSGHARDRSRDYEVGAQLTTPTWQSQYLHALDTSRIGIYLDAAPITNLNATMEANVQLMLQGYEPPEFLVTSLEKVYKSHGHGGSTARIDGEF